MEALQKELPNGWTVVLEFWGIHNKPNVYGVLTEYEKLVHEDDIDYKSLIKTPIKGIAVQTQFVRLEEGTSFGNKNTIMALETLEDRLLKYGNGDYYIKNNS